MSDYNPDFDGSPSNTYMAVIYKYNKEGKLKVEYQEFKYKPKPNEFATAGWAWSYYFLDLYPLTEEDRRNGSIIKKIVSIEKFKKGNENG